MQNTIIIIESPNKIEKIKQITKAEVFATKGHFKTLTKDFLENYNDYKPIFEFSNEESKKRMNYIFSQCKNKNVIIATDPDREGYAIGYMIYQTIKNIANNVKRAEFHEITENGIKKGIENSIQFSQSNLNDYESFKARVVGDKLVGFILSPKYINILHDKNISIGRVQTPALNLIVKRELEIEDFKNSMENNKIQYRIKVKLNKNDIDFTGINHNIYNTKEEAEKIIARLKDNEFAFVYDIKKTEKSLKPKMPFRTSQLQEESNKAFGYSPDTTMNLAQELFEKGLITYHRTDSNSISIEFLNELEQNLNNKEWYHKREYKAGKQSQAEAHEAIRITHYHDIKEIEDIITKNKLSDFHKNLYMLIYQNSILSQAKDSINEISNIDFDINTISFKANISKCKYKGFKEVFLNTINTDTTENINETDKEQEVNIEFKKDEKIKIMGFEIGEVKKQAPQRYKESNFISLLEKEGIGRPSTYSSFLPKLLAREYITINKKGKNNYIEATKKGIELIKILQEQDLWITTSDFTKQMEAVLDSISNGENKYIDFIKPIHAKMKFKEISNSKEIKPPTEKSLEYAKKLATLHNLELPKDIEKDFNICKNFIDKTQAIKQPPTEKQIKFAKDLSKEHNLELPKDIEKDFNICKNFIEKALEIGKKNRKNQ